MRSVPPVATSDSRTSSTGCRFTTSLDPTAPQPQPGTFLFSRDNGSVVAGIAELTLDGATAVLTLDRLGRDDELSFREGQLVEVTSADRELRGLPGFLAHTAAPTGADLPITWLGTPPVAPAEEAELGSHPIVRRWEGGPIPIGAAAVDLEDGIQVAFLPVARSELATTG